MIDDGGWHIDGHGCAGDAAAYVLGALDEHELAPFLAHLELCAICRDEVSSLQVVADMLPASVTPVMAPRALRRRVLATVYDEAELFRAASAPRVPAARRRRRFRPVHGGFQALALASIVAAAVAVGTFAVGGGSRPTRVIQASADSPTTAVLRLASGRMELDIANLPAPATGTVYEVWVKHHGAPQATDALFTPNSGGRATVEVPGNVRGSDTVMVTDEPAGGSSSSPTSSPVISASLR